jgi:hypothetical protein
MIVMNGPGRKIHSWKDRDLSSSGTLLALSPMRRQVVVEVIVLATRKPILLFRFSVLFLLRLAARRFLGLLFVTLKACLRHDDPPRKTRQGIVQGA